MLCISSFSLLEWLGFSLYVTLVKSHAKIPPKVFRSAGFGPFSPNSVHFGSNLDMLFQKSNKHQNLWNSLVIMVMAWLGPTFHEIRQSVGGENYRYRPPTTRWTPSRPIDVIMNKLSLWIPTMRVFIGKSTISNLLNPFIVRNPSSCRIT